MAKYKIVFNQSVAKDLHPIPNKDVKRILKRNKRLADNPRPSGSQKLSGEEKYRIRQGSSRILYMIEDDIITVTVVKIDHRKDIYK